MSTKAQEEKNQKILRQLLTLPDNKKCFDCSEKGPFYAVTTFGTFVCPNCSGIHREFGHRVKSISMATFKPEEVQFLESMGNGKAKSIWLATWTPDDFPEPDPQDKNTIRQFMKSKYIEKRWYVNPDQPSRSKSSSSSNPSTSSPVANNKLSGREQFNVNSPLPFTPPPSKQNPTSTFTTASKPPSTTPIAAASSSPQPNSNSSLLLAFSPDSARPPAASPTIHNSPFSTPNQPSVVNNNSSGAGGVNSPFSTQNSAMNVNTTNNSSPFGVSNNNPFGFAAAPTSGGVAVNNNSSQMTGLYGTGASGTGVNNTSSNSQLAGLYGTGANGAGVNISNNSQLAGLYGTGANGAGVNTSNNSQLAGLYGTNMSGMGGMSTMNMGMGSGMGGGMGNGMGMNGNMGVSPYFMVHGAPMGFGPVNNAAVGNSYAAPLMNMPVNTNNAAVGANMNVNGNTHTNAPAVNTNTSNANGGMSNSNPFGGLGGGFGGSPAASSGQVNKVNNTPFDPFA